jgi:hypothetical protein
VDKLLKASVDDDRREYKKSLKSGKKNEEKPIKEDSESESLLENAGVNENIPYTERANIKLDLNESEKSVMIESKIEDNKSEKSFNSISSSI